MLSRVFVTGYGVVSAFGNDLSAIKSKLALKENAICVMEDWKKYKDLHTFLAAPIINYAPPKEWNRKQMRSLGRVSQYSVQSAGIALKMAKLNDSDITNGQMGVAFGSSTGSTDAILQMAKMFLNDENNMNANTYLKFMPHTTAANIALFYQLKGRVIPTSSACTSGSHAIGYAYESIKNNKIDLMIAGGAEELCVSEAFTFNLLYATSLKNTTPKLTPSPFDKNRDGLVIGEGGAALILESENSLKKRGVKPLAEVVGFGSTCDGTHITRPNSETMKEAMILALKDAHIKASDIGYVNAHATATQWGDLAESIATNELFGENIAISSLKSYFGHTLGACGALESILSIEMMNDNIFFPTINLKDIDSTCARLDYLQDLREIKTNFVMNNNFAFGGINTSLIFKRGEA